MEQQDQILLELPELPSNVFVVNGKQVTLRERLLLIDTYNITALINKVSVDDLRTHIPVMKLFIESWDFDGDPMDDESYNTLDTIREFMPISEMINRYMNNTMADQLKNSARGYFLPSVSMAPSTSAK